MVLFFFGSDKKNFRLQVIQDAAGGNFLYENLSIFESLKTMYFSILNYKKTYESSFLCRKTPCRPMEF